MKDKGEKKKQSVLSLLTVVVCILAGCTNSSNSGMQSKSNVINSPSVTQSQSSQPVISAVQVTPVQPSNAPVINIFSIQPALIKEGSAPRLVWDVSNATSVSISPSIGLVSSAGTMSVYPSTSTVYRITAYNAEGTATASSAVYVVERKSTMIPVIIAFSSRPRVISENETCTLSWIVFGATSISINSTYEKLDATGTIQVAPTTTTSYTITATNHYGSVTANTDITVLKTMSIPVEQSYVIEEKRTVNAIDYMPIIDCFSADYNSMPQGNRCTLSWNVIQADNVTLNGKLVGISGSQKIIPSGTNTYTLIGVNNYGKSTKTVVVYSLPFKTEWYKPLIQ